MSSKHWDVIYSTKSEDQVSWFEAVPKRSLELISELEIPKDANIIDIGGGESHLTDNLLSKGFQNLTILDISEVAIEKTKKRIGPSSVKYIVSNITEFKPTQKYDLWHDRATFHFLTNSTDVEAYLRIADDALLPDGHLIVSTFSKTGPEKCSGLTISQYSESDLKLLFQKYFDNVRCFEDTHTTPWGSSQDFVYCGFKKKSHLHGR